MNKDRFVAILNELKAARDMQDEVDNIMKKYRDKVRSDYMDSTFTIAHDEIVIDLLQEMMNDDTDWISWWVYETNYGEHMTKIYDNEEDGNVIADLKTASDLYDFLMQNGGDSND